MKISVKQVKYLNNKLSSIIDKYENNYLQYYNILNHTQDDWFDNKAKIFFETVDDDKKADINTLQEMKTINSIYNYLINNYEEIGQDIYYNPSKKEQILTLLDNIIEQTKIIIKDYNSIGIYNYSERSLLYSQKNIFMNLLEKEKYIRNRINNTMYKIEDIEKLSKEEFSKITIEPILEKDIFPFK